MATGVHNLTVLVDAREVANATRKMKAMAAVARETGKSIDYITDAARQGAAGVKNHMGVMARSATDAARKIDQGVRTVQNSWRIQERSAKDAARAASDAERKKIQVMQEGLAALHNNWAIKRRVMEDEARVARETARQVAQAERDKARATRESARAMARSFHRLGAAASGAFGRMQTAFFGFSLTFASLRLGRSILETTAMFERLDVVLGTLLRSQEKVNKAQAEILALARSTPATLLEVTKGYTRLIQSGSPLEEVAHRMEQITDIASGSIYPIGEAMDRLTKVYQRAEGGFIELQDVELVETIGLPFTRALKDVFDVTRHGLKDLVKNIGAKETFDQIMDHWAALYQGNADKMMSKLTGANQRLKQSLQLAFQDIGDEMSGPLVNMASKIETLLQTNEDGLQSFGRFLGDIVDGFSALFQMLLNNQDVMKDLIALGGMIPAIWAGKKAARFGGDIVSSVRGGKLPLNLHALLGAAGMLAFTNSIKNDVQEILQDDSISNVRVFFTMLNLGLDKVKEWTGWARRAFGIGVEGEMSPEARKRAEVSKGVFDTVGNRMREGYGYKHQVLGGGAGDDMLIAFEIGRENAALKNYAESRRSLWDQAVGAVANPVAAQIAAEEDAKKYAQTMARRRSQKGKSSSLGSNYVRTVSATTPQFADEGFGRLADLYSDGKLGKTAQAYLDRGDIAAMKGSPDPTENFLAKILEYDRLDKFGARVGDWMPAKEGSTAKKKDEEFSRFARPFFGPEPPPGWSEPSRTMRFGGAFGAFNNELLSGDSEGNRSVKEAGKNLLDGIMKEFANQMQEKANAPIQAFASGFINEITDALFDASTDSAYDAGADLARGVIDGVKDALTGGQSAGGSFVSSMISSFFGGGGIGAGAGATSARGFAGASVTSREGGGFTGRGNRSGGLDGKGGFLEMRHPNELVFDLHKNTPKIMVQGNGGPTNVNIKLENAPEGYEVKMKDQYVKHDEIGLIAEFTKREMMEDVAEGGEFDQLMRSKYGQQTATYTQTGG